VRISHCPIRFGSFLLIAQIDFPFHPNLFIPTNHSCCQPSSTVSLTNPLTFPRFTHRNTDLLHQRPPPLEILIPCLSINISQSPAWTSQDGDCIISDSFDIWAKREDLQWDGCLYTSSMTRRFSLFFYVGCEYASAWTCLNVLFPLGHWLLVSRIKVLSLDT